MGLQHLQPAATEAPPGLPPVSTEPDPAVAAPSPATPPTAMGGGGATLPSSRRTPAPFAARPAMMPVAEPEPAIAPRFANTSNALPFNNPYASNSTFVPAVAAMRELLSPLPEQMVQVVVDLGDRQTYVYRGTEQVGAYPVAIGMDGWETPTGRFQVIDKQVDPHWQHPITRADIPPGPGNPLGSRWIAFLPMEDGVIGFHGTYQTELLGQAVSHGCIRMHNADIEALFEQVSLGTPVIVQP